VGVRGGEAIFFFNQSIGTEETNTFQLKFCIYHENCGRHRPRRFVGFSVGVAYSRNKLALRTRLRNLNLKSLFVLFVYLHIYLLEPGFTLCRIFIGAKNFIIHFRLTEPIEYPNTLN